MSRDPFKNVSLEVYVPNVIFFSFPGSTDNKTKQLPDWGDEEEARF